MSAFEWQRRLRRRKDVLLIRRLESEISEERHKRIAAEDALRDSFGEGLCELMLNQMALGAERVEAENVRLRAAARKAHDAMMDWHFVYGNPSALMSPEEAEMGEACKTIAALLDEEPPLESEKVARLRAQVGRLQDYADDLAARLTEAEAFRVPELQREHLEPTDLDPLEKQRNDGYTGPRVYVGGSEIRPFREVVERDDA